jgi:hypothetical protein
LPALEPSRRIEEAALLAGMKIRFAFRALRFQRDLQGDGSAAHRTAGGFMEARHLPGSELLRAFRTGILFRFFLALTSTVHVAMLLVLAIHNFSLKAEFSDNFALWKARAPQAEARDTFLLASKLSKLLSVTRRVQGVKNLKK